MDSAVSKRRSIFLANVSMTVLTLNLYPSRNELETTTVPEFQFGCIHDTSELTSISHVRLVLPLGPQARTSPSRVQRAPALAQFGVFARKCRLKTEPLMNFDHGNRNPDATAQLVTATRT